MKGTFHAVLLALLPILGVSPALASTASESAEVWRVERVTRGDRSPVRRIWRGLQERESGEVSILFREHPGPERVLPASPFRRLIVSRQAIRLSASRPVPPVTTDCPTFIEFVSSVGTRRFCEIDIPSDSDVRTILGDLSGLRGVADP